MNEIEKQLQVARQSLLDLSMRNRLLHFRPTKSRTLCINQESVREVYEALVLKEKGLEFRPKMEEKKDKKKPLLLGEEALPEESEEILFEKEWNTLPLFDREPVSLLQKERSLQTSLETTLLYKTLSHINQQARSFVEEQGYTILYLALGFLEWFEKNDQKAKRSPLILVPVELERLRLKDPFKLRWTGEEILGNISLQEKLLEHGVQLPEFEMIYEKEGIDLFFQKVQESCIRYDQWKVLSGIYLDFFSFTKFVMYKDLAPEVWPEGMLPSDHPLIRSILCPSSDHQESAGFLEEQIDEKMSAHKTYHIMDADSSQLAVIEDVKAGRSLVVEGPPGTGKSQTITNIIAELLASGKSVLFMSEKMAALEVVKSRLDVAGLGEFCLELHSQKTKKKEFIEELKRSTSTFPPDPVSIEEKCDLLENLKAELNDYVRVLREPFGKIGRSPYDLICMKETALRHFASSKRAMSRFKFSGLKDCDQKEWTQTLERFSHLAKAFSSVKPISRNPWRGCDPGTVLPADKEEIQGMLKEIIQKLEDLESAINRLTRVCSVKSPVNGQELQYLLPKIKKITSATPLTRAVYLNAEWNQLPPDAEKWTTQIEAFQQKMLKFSTKALDYNLSDLYEEYKEVSKKLLRFMDGRYRYLNKEIVGLYKNLPPKDIQRVIADLERLMECFQIREELRKNQKKGESLFGVLWQAEQSDPQKMRQFAQEMVSFRQELTQQVLRDPSLDFLRLGASWENLQQVTEEVEGIFKQFLNIQKQLVGRLNLDYQNVFGQKFLELPFFDLLSRFRLWSTESERLQSWGQYMVLRKECASTRGQPLLETIENDVVEPEDIVPCLQGNFADEMLRLAFLEKTELAKFIGELHEDKIKRFRDIDQELIYLNRKRLVYKLYQNRPRLTGGASPGSEAGILLGEFNRKRRHMPIRKLLSLTGSLIQKIKPCFMMSPLSIAKFLDPQTVRFDVIVFDEASQVKPEDAFGALLRGKQLVVMGDTCQLPPTSFFENILEADDGDGSEEAAITDMESILHQCKRSFPTKILRWHYRSKHESLIAISNQEFYNNRLFVYPSPISRSPFLGLKFVHLDGTIYDRGRSGTNRKEAEEVAKAAIEHYRLYPDKSLGIAAFNVKQQDVLLEEVEKQLRLHPEMEEFFRSNRPEHFFVKNLETIQGDERDVILISIGFGFTEAGRFSLNFGPLNQNGGERRLNVLISRAREKCVVYANFHARDLILDQSAPIGLRAFKTFLDYAENGYLRSSQQQEREQKESSFEQSLYEFLLQHGKVERHLGCGGFRLDFAVLDPNSSGRYLLGIECDGPKYHQTKIARDRDRLRSQILEALGWRLYRVWSTDWYCNRTETEHMIVEAIREAKRSSSINLLTHQPEPKKENTTTNNVTVKTTTDELLRVPIHDTKNISQMIQRISSSSQEELPIPLEETKGTEFSNKPISESPPEILERSLLIKNHVVPASEEDILLPPSTSSLPLQTEQEENRSSPFVSEETSAVETEKNVETENEASSEEEMVTQEIYYDPEDAFARDTDYEEEATTPVPSFFYSNIPKQKPTSLYPKLTSFQPPLEKKIIVQEDSALAEENENEAQEDAPLTSSVSEEESLVPFYKPCQTLEVSIAGKLQEANLATLALAVAEVVRIEGPLHSSEVLRRIRTIGGVKRLGTKIQEAIQQAIDLAEEKKEVIRKNDFFWPKEGPKNLVRKRRGDPPARIDLICDEEIAEAVQLVLKHQYATLLPDLVTQSSRLLGFQGTHRKTFVKIEEIISGMLEQKILRVKNNNMIDLSDSSEKA